MPNGHFRIGDLSFSYDGDLTELAEVQSLMREVRRAEGRLKAASGADRVVLIYDQDLEGEQGTFDRMRLRAYTSEKNFTLDIGNTDNNPLGIYVGFAQPIRVYDREEGRAHYLDNEGNAYEREEEAEAAIKGDAPKEGASSEAASSEPDTEGSASQSAGGKGEGEKDLQGAAEALIEKFSGASGEAPAGEIEIGGAALPSKIVGLAQYAGRSEEYIRRVRNVWEASSFAELAVNEARDAIRMMADPQRLEDAETVQENQDDLPF